MRSLVSLLWLLGCAPDEAETGSPSSPVGPCESGAEPSAEAGHGELRFMHFEEGHRTPIELVHGPQGGFHSTIAVRAQQLNPDTAYVVDLVGTIDGLEMGGGTPLSKFRCNHHAGAQEFTGGLLIWDAQPEDVHDRVATVAVYVIDPTQETGNGHPVIVAQDTAEFTIWDPALEN